MSPEQTAGGVADRRSDMWAFGVVLLEMLTGRPVFAGGTPAHVLAAVLNHDPDWTRLPAVTPVPVRRLLRRCLQRDRNRRLESAADARLEIDDALTPLGDEAGGGAVASGRQRPAWRMGWLATAVLAIVVAAGGVAVLNTRQGTLLSQQFAIPVSDEVSQMALSADGRFLAFVMPDDSGRHLLHVQPVGAPRATVLTGTHGASFPFWSPDNAYVGFFADGKLMKVRPSGGAAQVIVDVTASDAVRVGAART